MPSPVSEFDEAYDDFKEPPAMSGEVLEHPIRALEPREAVLIPSTASVAEAVNAMNAHRTGCLLVMEAGTLVGVFTDRDVVWRALPLGAPLDQVRVHEIMSRDLDVLTMDDPIAFALNRMAIGDSRHVALVDEGGQPLAVVSVRDIAKFVAEHFAGTVHNLPPVPSRRSSDYPPHGAA